MAIRKNVKAAMGGRKTENFYLFYVTKHKPIIKNTQKSLNF